MPVVKDKNFIIWNNMGEDKNLKFVGIPYEKNKNLNQIVSDLAEKIEVPIKDEDLSIAHRLKASQNAKPNTYGLFDSVAPSIVSPARAIRLSRVPLCIACIECNLTRFLSPIVHKLLIL